MAVSNAEPAASPVAALAFTRCWKLLDSEVVRLDVQVRVLVCATGQ